MDEEKKLNGDNIQDYNRFVIINDIVVALNGIFKLLNKTSS